MSSIQFNYFADEKGEQIIRKELLNKFGTLYTRDFFGKKKSSIDNIEGFRKISNSKFYLSPDILSKEIKEWSEENVIDYRNSPVIDYVQSGTENDKFYSGRLGYFAGNKFPEFKKEVQSLFRKLKKYCWKDKQWQYWVFETIGDEVTVFIPNRIVQLKRYTN